MKTGPKPRPVEERFWAKVDRSGECWVWTGATARFGYGHFRVGGWGTSPTPAHRASWALHFGPVPSGLAVMHRCDNPPCVRPDHLMLGTRRDNMRDMDEKGRRGVWHPAGHLNPRYKDGRRMRPAQKVRTPGG